MSRSQYKEPFLIKSLLSEKIRKNKKIWSRNSIITPQFVGLSFKVYQGKRFINIKVTEEMIGHKFGEFAPTRQRQHKKKKKK
jgi:small subunit ribosomal protein S19